MGPHRLGAAADFEALQAANGGDQEGKERRLGQADEKMLHTDVALQQGQEHGGRDIQRQRADHAATDDAADHREEG
ncbi:hypothetical protein D3C72_2311250 [compost metagenome]